MLAFWMGGASALVAVPIQTGLTGGMLIDKRRIMDDEYNARQRLLEFDEDELLEMMGMSTHIL